MRMGSDELPVRLNTELRIDIVAVTRRQRHGHRNLRLNRRYWNEHLIFTSREAQETLTVPCTFHSLPTIVRDTPTPLPDTFNLGVIPLEVLHQTMACLRFDPRQVNEQLLKLVILPCLPKVPAHPLKEVTIIRSTRPTVMTDICIRR